ncbi:MAG: RsbRD N-terminal domain-containing protein [bacterium]
MLQQLLTQKKLSVLKKWFQAVVDTYPPDTSQFLKREQDPFANPVGSTIFRGMEAIYEELLRGGRSENLSSFLDRILRIRAVQDFAPSKAVGFILDLKAVLREELSGEDLNEGLEQELLDLERRIDDLILVAFDVYMQCREKVCDARVGEIKAQKDAALRLLEITDLAQKKRLGGSDSEDGEP